MELKQLRHFVAIVELGNFSRAAEVISISQPALTRSIKLLEDRLGVALLERSTRQVSPTPAGLRLYKRGKLILRETDAAITLVKDDAKRDRPLRVGIAPMIATTIIPAAIHAMSEKYPDMELNVESGLFGGLTDRLLQADLDIVVSNLPYGSIDESLISKSLFDIDVVYAASSSHPFAKSKDISVPELLSYPWAVVDENHANDLYMQIFANHGGAKSPIRVRTNSLNLLKSLVESPPWITLLPLHIVKAELQRGSLIALDVAGDKVRRNGGIVYRRSQSEDQDIERFANFIRDAAQIKF